MDNLELLSYDIRVSMQISFLFKSTWLMIFLAFFGFQLPLFSGENGLTQIEVRAGWEKYPQADFGTNIIRLEPLPVDAITNLTTKHSTQLGNSRLGWLANFTKTNLARDSGFKGHVEVGMAYAQNLFYPEAIEWMRKALTLNSQSSFVYNNLANVYYLSGNIQLALTNYQLALAYSRNDPRTLLNLAFINYETGQTEAAKNYYLKAILIDPSLDRPEYQVLAGDDKAPANPNSHSHSHSH